MFVFEPSLDFDSDQAIFGLMAKHLVEGRAFPLFMYGQNYMPAVEEWLAAPIFLLFGASVAALKLPLLFINVAVGLLLVWLFERELGLRPVYGLVASLFFVLAPPGTVGVLLATNGGNVEPLLYVLLLWALRRRALWFGLIAGLGFIHREFTLYGVIAVIAIEAAWGIRGRPAMSGLLDCLLRHLHDQRADHCRGRRLPEDSGVRATGGRAPRAGDPYLTCTVRQRPGGPSERALLRARVAA